MNPPADLPDFVQNHRPHGPLTADATQPAWEWLSTHGGVCMWGGVWAVTPEDADALTL
jgi:hypothetical protein